jgi:AcrR family transcriptional regulator
MQLRPPIKATQPSKPAGTGRAGPRARGPRGAEPRPDRRHAILLAAEKLFAQHGYHAVTIREIADEACVPLALVGYYFGAKHELFHSIFEHWNHTIEERLAALREIDTAVTGRAALTRVIEAFTGPVIRLRASPEGEYYALLVARELYHAREETDRILRGFFDPLAHAFIDALQRLLPHATRGQAAWVYQFALGALLHHLSDGRVERLSNGEAHAGDADAAPLLVAFIVGGIEAALPPPPTPQPPRLSASLKKTTSRRPA